MLRHLSLCFVLGLFIPSVSLAFAEPAADDVKLFEETKRQAESGDVDAQYRLAGMHARGAGTAKDDAEALKWFRKVAEKNDPRGQSMLGVFYTNARAVPRDYDEAMKWFRLAAAQNSAHAMYNLGHMYSTGKGVNKSDEESAAWYRKAAERNEVNSQRILGGMYSLGRGVPKDLVQAWAWITVSTGTTTDVPAATRQQLATLAAQLTPEQQAAAKKLSDEIALRVRPAPANKPVNFLLIFADDLGYGDVSMYRESDVRTPHLDRLAAEGMLFTSMRANCTVCSPSRAALLTGKYPDRVGVPGVIRTKPEDSWGYFDPRTPTLADELKKVGYHTAIVGKWHLGLESPNTPNERGFDFFHGFLGDMMDSYTKHLRHGHNYLRRNQEVIEPTGHATDLFTDWANAYLRERAQQPATPFFLYLAYNAPHFPIEPPAEWLAKVKQRAPGLSDKRAANVAFVEHLDDRVGRVLATLKETGLAENTVVIFSADNGGSLPHSQNNDPWRDGKQSHYDGGLRVPFVLRWPGQVAAGSRSDYAGLNFDLCPTFLEIAAAKPSPDLDAVSLLPILKGGSISTPRDLYFIRREGGSQYGGKTYEALIRGDWKLMQNDPYSPLELYNLKDDPQETRNLAATNKKIVNKLSAALRLHMQRGGSTPWQAAQTPAKPTAHK